jgi:hypothetical protein
MAELTRSMDGQLCDDDGVANGTWSTVGRFGGVVSFFEIYNSREFGFHAEIAETPKKPDPLLGNLPRKERGLYKPKNGLDGFLRFAIGGKYKWRRYEIFKDYLCHKYSQKEAKAIIEKYQTNGVPNHLYQGIIDELMRWSDICNRERGKSAARARWEKTQKSR